MGVDKNSRMYVSEKNFQINLLINMNTYALAYIHIYRGVCEGICKGKYFYFYNYICV